MSGPGRVKWKELRGAERVACGGSGSEGRNVYRGSSRTSVDFRLCFVVEVWQEEDRTQSNRCTLLFAIPGA